MKLFAIELHTGLVNIDNSCDGFTTDELVKQNLADFGLLFTKIIASTHSGDVLMQIYEQIIPVDSQLYHNQSIIHSITNVLYKTSHTCDN